MKGSVMWKDEPGATTVEWLGLATIAVLVIAILSMFLTPADPGSMLLMGVPLVGLYFGGILLCRYMPGHAVAKRGEPPEATSGS